ncbi:hypothetical protein LIER_11155 [Lithospermum erythrorhizon]|uniref:Uncharacterized protein n=1 Tax=Lithospermum erythrorhizon TaxID=34254 RepID=A0AAV3PN80_LITER
MRPLFRKSKVRKVPASSSTHARNELSPSPAAATSTSTTAKRPAPEEGRPKTFAPRKKHVAQRLKRIEHVTISEDLPTTFPPPPVPTDNRMPLTMPELKRVRKGYDDEWFANRNLDAPLTPEDDGEKEPFPGDNAPAS